MEKPTDSIYDPTAWSRMVDYGRFQQDAFLDMPINEILKKDIQQGENILDVGCGAGRMASLFDGADYTGIDITPEYIAMAREKYPQHKWVDGDCRSLPFPDKSFDRVWSCNLLIHLPWDDVKASLNEMFRVARNAIYLVSRFGPNEDTYIEMDLRHATAFIYNTIPFKELERPGWVLEKVEDGSLYVVLRKSI